MVHTFTKLITMSKKPFWNKVSGVCVYYYLVGCIFLTRIVCYECHMHTTTRPCYYVAPRLCQSTCHKQSAFSIRWRKNECQINLFSNRKPTPNVHVFSTNVMCSISILFMDDTTTEKQSNGIYQNSTGIFTFILRMWIVDLTFILD